MHCKAQHLGGSVVVNAVILCNHRVVRQAGDERGELLSVTTDADADTPGAVCDCGEQVEECGLKERATVRSTFQRHTPWQVARTHSFRLDDAHSSANGSPGNPNSRLLTDLLDDRHLDREPKEIALVWN